MTRRPAFQHRLRHAGASGVLVVALLVTGCQANPAEPEAQSSGSEGTSADAGAGQQSAELDTPRLRSADNFRDIAGIDTAYAVTGGHLRPGAVYRSNELALDDEDLATLEAMDIATVIDLRTPEEIEKQPDRVPQGAEYANVDILGEATSAAAISPDIEVTTPEDSARMLQGANIAFVKDAGMREQFGTVLSTIAEADGPVIVHCTAGKDRAGWTAAVLQLTAGVGEEDVMANYLATNEYTADRIEATTEQIRQAKGDEQADAYRVLLGVEESFLQAGLDEMTTEFGGIDGYLKDGLGLDDETIAALKGKLVTA